MIAFRPAVLSKTGSSPVQTENGYHGAIVRGRKSHNSDDSEAENKKVKKPKKSRKLAHEKWSVV